MKGRVCVKGADFGRVVIKRCGNKGQAKTAGCSSRVVIVVEGNRKFIGLMHCEYDRIKEVKL